MGFTTNIGHVNTSLCETSARALGTSHTFLGESHRGIVHCMALESADPWFVESIGS